MKTRDLTIRWSLLTGGLIALFWAGYYFFVGSVPVVASIKMTDSWIYILPFGISRWWDILIGPIWSTIIILLVDSERFRRKEGDETIALAFGLIFTLLIGLLIGLTVGGGEPLCNGLLIGLAGGLPAILAFFGLFYGLDAVILVFRLMFELDYGLSAALGIGLGID